MYSMFIIHGIKVRHYDEFRKLIGLSGSCSDILKSWDDWMKRAHVLATMERKSRTCLKDIQLFKEDDSAGKLVYTCSTCIFTNVILYLIHFRHQRHFFLIHYLFFAAEKGQKCPPPQLLYEFQVCMHVYVRMFEFKNY